MIKFSAMFALLCVAILGMVGCGGDDDFSCTDACTKLADLCTDVEFVDEYVDQCNSMCPQYTDVAEATRSTFESCVDKASDCEAIGLCFENFGGSETDDADGDDTEDGDDTYGDDYDDYGDEY